MVEKITIQNLIDVLCVKHSMDKKDAELFVKGIFDLVEESLATEKYVKIKGLGTFKLIEVDSRESINVNTGERIEIHGHTKISFTPENSLKEQINKPFSHFETVVLGDNYEEVSFDEESANNIEEPVSEVAIDSELQEKQFEEIAEDLKETSSAIIEIVPESVTEEKVEVEVYKEEIKKEERNENSTETSGLEKTGKKKTGKLVYILILLIILIIGGLYWLFGVNKSNNIVQTETATATEIIAASEHDSVKIVDENTTINKSQIQKDTAIISVMKEEKVAALADTMEYRIVGTKTTHILQKGETIIRVSLKYYGTKNYWPYIAKHNEEIIKDANNVPVGTKLLIPELTKKQ